MLRTDRWRRDASLVLLVVALLLVLTSCTGYFAPGGAALYCKDRHGKAIHCPNTPKADSTRADTSRKGEG